MIFAVAHSMRYSISIFCVLTIFGISACSSASKERSHPVAADSTFEHATFALGCFWHSEEIFLEIKGVKEALPGYAGGTVVDPTYDEVCSNGTGHAETVDVTYDPSQISYAKLLEVFFAEHDPTTMNRQGPDIGSQYRSAIFYHNADQKREAETYIAKLTSEHKYASPIVTQVVPFTKFYRAEDYQLRYYRNHPDQGYVAGVTKPEVEKFRRDFPELVKP